MIEYREKHGNLLFKRNCSDEENTLKTWISTQKKVFRKGKMPMDRMEKLKAANFIWDPEDTYEQRWEEKYAELARFYESHGHMIVSGKKNSALTTWMRHQRANRERGILSQDRIDMLDKLKFSWTEAEVKFGLIDRNWLENASLEPHLERWKANFKQLIEFKERVGHLDVSTTDDTTLYNWIYQQRLRHRRGLLPMDRVRWLESIGFEWNIENGNQTDEQWNLMFTKLKQFKEKNGHFANRILRAWVRTQNTTQCRDRPDRRAKLEEIGFPFQEVDSFGSSLPPTRSIPRKRTARDSVDEYDDQQVTLKGRKLLCASRSTTQCSERSDTMLIQEDIGLLGQLCDTPSSPLASIQSLPNKQTDLESDDENEDESLTRTGGKPMSQRGIRKARRDNQIYEEAKAASTSLALRSTRGRPNAITKESLTTKPNVPTPKNSATPPNATNTVYPVGTKLVNFFPGHGWYKGTVQAVDEHKYTVLYEDGDVEEFLIEGPTMDALVELAKSNPDKSLGDSAPAAAMTSCALEPMCADNERSSGGRKRPRDIAKGERTRNKKARSADTYVAEEVCRTAEIVGLNAGDSMVEGDDAIEVHAGDGTANLKAKFAELDRLLKDSNKAVTEAQAELQNMDCLLRQRERRRDQKDKLIDQLKARIVDLEHSQFVSGSVAQKVMFRLKDKL